MKGIESIIGGRVFSHSTVPRGGVGGGVGAMKVTPVRSSEVSNRLTASPEMNQVMNNKHI